MTLGAQTVTLVTLTEDPTDRDAFNTPATVRTETEVRGCRLRLVSSTEATSPGNRVVETWKLTAPPHQALLTASNRDEVISGGETFAILGTPRTVLDMNGKPHHVNVTAQRTLG